MNTIMLWEITIVTVSYHREFFEPILFKQCQYNKIKNQMKMNQLQIYQSLILPVNPLVHLLRKCVSICVNKIKIKWFFIFYCELYTTILNYMYVIELEQ